MTSFLKGIFWPRPMKISIEQLISLPYSFSMLFSQDINLRIYRIYSYIEEIDQNCACGLEFLKVTIFKNRYFHFRGLTKV